MPGVRYRVGELQLEPDANVQTAVKEVLDITGFSDILDLV